VGSAEQWPDYFFSISSRIPNTKDTPMKTEDNGMVHAAEMAQDDLAPAPDAVTPDVGPALPVVRELDIKGAYKVESPGGDQAVLVFHFPAKGKHRLTKDDIAQLERDGHAVVLLGGDGVLTIKFTDKP
jgi:hypothetical protein